MRHYMREETEMRKWLHPFLKDMEAPAIFREIEGQTDRAAAIVAFTYLDLYLSQAICSHLYDQTRQHKQAIKELWGQPNAFQAFSARRRLASLLGLFGPETFKDLDRLAKIRNIFAHFKETYTFESQQIKGLCDALYIANKIQWDSDSGPPGDARGKYLFVVRLVTGLLLSEMTDNTPIRREPRFLQW